METRHADLGSMDRRIDCPAGQACVPEAFPTGTSPGAKRAGVAVMGILPITDSVEAFARVGVACTELDASVQHGVLGTDRASGDSTDGVDWRRALRMDDARTSELGATDVDLDTLSFDVRYRFGG